MKLAMITSWDRECGIYSYTRPLVEEMRRQGHDVQVICHQDARLGDSIHPVIDQADPAWFEAVDAEVASIAPDLVHVQFEYGLYSYQHESPFAGVSAANAFGMNSLLFRWRLRGLPAVVTMHSDNSDRPDRIAFIRTMGQLPAMTLVHTRHTELPSGKVEIVPHVAPVAKGIRPDKARYGWEGKKVAGMIGYPDWYKRYDRMVALWPRVLEQLHEPAILVVACAPRPGSSESVELGAALTAAVEASPACDSIVNFQRLFTQDEFLRVVASFDVLVLPYESAAASGPNMAACAVGTPVVASSVGGLRSYIEHSRAGVGVPRYNDDALVHAVARTLKDDRRRAQMSRNARSYARQVSLSRTVRKHLRHYRWAIAHTQPLI